MSNIRIYKGLFYLLVSLTVLPIFSQASLGPKCSDVFSHRTTETWIDEVFAEIELIRQDRFDETLLSEEPPRFYEGDNVQIRRSSFTEPTAEGQTFTVKKWLGSGEEGEVYLIENTKGEKFVYKVFFEAAEAVINHRDLIRYQELFPGKVVAIRAFDRESGVLLLDYVNGEPLSDVLASSHLPQGARQRLLDEFNRMLDQTVSNGIFGLVDANAVVRKSDQQLIIIDPN